MNAAVWWLHSRWRADWNLPYAFNRAIKLSCRLYLYNENCLWVYSRPQSQHNFRSSRSITFFEKFLLQEQMKHKHFDTSKTTLSRRVIPLLQNISGRITDAQEGFRYTSNFQCSLTKTRFNAWACRCSTNRMRFGTEDNSISSDSRTVAHFLDESVVHPHSVLRVYCARVQ